LFFETRCRLYGIEWNIDKKLSLKPDVINHHNEVTGKPESLYAWTRRIVSLVWQTNIVTSQLITLHNGYRSYPCKCRICHSWWSLGMRNESTPHCCKKMTQLWNWNCIARNYMDRFWILVFGSNIQDSRIEFACFNFHVRLLISLLLCSDLSNCILKLTHACCNQSAVERAFSCCNWDSDLCQ